MRYDVVLVGYRLNARLKPAQALQAVLGLEAEACKELLQKFPATVLTGVSQSRAEKVVEQLNDAGGKAEVHVSRISLAAEPEKSGGSVRPFPANDESGNYAIGEILAPLPKKNASTPPKDEAPAPKRPSREELDQAIRDSFRPNAQEAASSKARGGEHDLAFAGLQNFDDSLDGFDKKGPALEVDEVALRSTQRKPEAATSAKGAAKRLTFQQRAVKFLRRMLSTSFDWSMGLVSLAVVVAITLYAVGYALDPEHAVSALKLEQLPSSVREATGKLLGK